MTDERVGCLASAQRTASDDSEGPVAYYLAWPRLTIWIPSVRRCRASPLGIAHDDGMFNLGKEQTQTSMNCALLLYG